MEADTSPKLLTAISEASGIAVPDLRQDMALEEIGLDSLDVLDLLVNLDVPREAISELHTIGDIEAYLSDREVG